MKRRTNRVPAALLVACALSLPGALRAQTGAWSNAAGGSWTNSTNWVGGVIADGMDSLADFTGQDISATRTVTLDANRTIGYLSFADSTTPFSGWTLNPGSPSGVLTLAVSSGAPTISMTTQTLTIAASLAGTSGFTKIGKGIVTLSASNSYSGTTTVKGGRLNVNNSFALGDAASGVVLAPDGTLGYATLGLNSSVTGKTVTLIGRDNNNRAVFAGNNATWNGSVVIAGTNNNLNLIQIDGGTFTIDGNVTNSGVVNASVQLRGSTGTGIVNGAINVTGGIAKNDAGTWVLNGTNNSWTDMTVSEGRLKMGAANVCVPAAPVTFSVDKATATLDLNGFNQTIRSLASAGTSGAGLYSGKVVSATSATLTIDTPSGTNINYSSIQGAISLVKTGAGTQALRGTNTYGGTTAINAGTLQLAAADVLPDTTDVTLGGGTLDLGSQNETVRSLTVASTGGGVGGVAAGRTLSLNGTGDALTWTAAKGITPNLALTGASGGSVVVTNFTGGPATLDGSLDLGGVDRTFWIADVNAAGSDLFLNGPVAGAGGIVKVGPGTLKLVNATNTFTGNLDVQQGSLFLQNAGNRIADAAAVRISGGSLDLNSATETVGRVTLAAGGITGAGAGDRLVSDIGFDVESGTIGTVTLGGAAGLTKTTAGTTTVAAVLAYAGNTIVSNGTLRLSGAAAPTNSPAIRIAAGATLDTAGLASPLSLGSGQTLSGSGTLSGGLIMGAGATLAPGSSPGTLSLQDSLTMNAGSVLAIELDGPAAGSGYDQLAFLGGNDTFTLNGATLAVADGVAFSPDQVFTIVVGYQSLAGAGTFAGHDDGDTVTGAHNEFRINYGATAVTLTVVPEPGTAGLVGLCALALLLRRRRNA